MRCAAIGKMLSVKYYNEVTIHLPALFLESKNTDRVAGKTDGTSDRSKNARKSDCTLSGGAGSRLDIVTFKIN